MTDYKYFANLSTRNDLGIRLGKRSSKWLGSGSKTVECEIQGDYAIARFPNGQVRISKSAFYGTKWRYRGQVELEPSDEPPQQKIPPVTKKYDRRRKYTLAELFEMDEMDNL